MAIGTHPPSPDQSAGNGVAFVMGGEVLHSHYGATLGFLLLEGGGDELGLAGQVQQAFGQPTGRAGLGKWLQLVNASQRSCAEHAVDALLRGEC